MSFNLLTRLQQYMVPQHGLTALAGYFADVKNIRIKNYLIQRFIQKFQVNMQEALLEEPGAYACFNDFFIRHLKPECRPIAQADIISPVDGSVSEIGSIEEDQLIQAKGHYYSVAELLACTNEVAKQFTNGHFATLYLSPKDYHRVHMPVNAEVMSMTYIPGALFSVQPKVAQAVPRLFARNERLAVFFDSESGPMAMVMVGATIVGAIGTSWHGDIQRSKNRIDFDYGQASASRALSQGDEMGYFKLGSTVVLLFGNSTRVSWNSNLKAGSPLRFGEAIGEIKRHQPLM